MITEIERSRPSLVLTVFEKTAAAALQVVSDCAAGPALIELRVDGFEDSSVPLSDFVAASRVPLIFTRRHDRAAIDATELNLAVDAGFAFVDCEYSPDFDYSALAPLRDHLLLSHHDFEKTPDAAALEELIAGMKAVPAAHYKIALTANTFADNQMILDAASRYSAEGFTIFGMGPRGMYSRILAPFVGPGLVFVASSDETVAAPGQLTLQRSLAIFGDLSVPLPSPLSVFAIAGNPAAHSLSPSIHNAIFRERGVDAAYTILECESFEEAAAALASEAPLTPLGLSVTAPYKQDALTFARAHSAEISFSAYRAGAVNTLVWIGETLIADNTDVLGLRELLRAVDAKKIAIVGAGGTARAALVALEKRGADVTLYNRDLERASLLAKSFQCRARPLEALKRFEGDLLISTLPADAEVPFPRVVRLVLDANYSGANSIARDAAAASIQRIDGKVLLQAQASAQSELFLRAVERRQR